MDEPETIKELCAPKKLTDEELAELEKAREARIAARRARIKDKISKDKADAGEDLSTASSSLDLMAMDEEIAAGEKDEEGKEKDSDVKVQTSADSLEKQIEESRKQLEQLILDGETMITNVKVAAEYREKVRHDKQDLNRKERLERLQKEAEESQQLYEELNKTWSLETEHKLPLELNEQIKAQQDLCDALNEKKDDLIYALRREIEENDFEYENNLEIYQKDVTLMGDRIDDHIDDLRATFLEELRLIENSTCRNRQSVLEENHKQWMEQLNGFEEMEHKALEDRKREAIEKFQTLNELFATTKQETRKIRNKLEDDSRLLLQESEKLKAACQLNLEKMDFNLYVLKNKEMENIQKKNRLKRLLVRLQDRFTEKSCMLRVKIENGRRQSDKIIKEIYRYEDLLATIGKRTLNLATTDYKKYMDLWSGSEEIMREKVNKLLESERFIYETQLALEYQMPDFKPFDKRPLEVQNFINKKQKLPPQAPSVVDDESSLHQSSESMESVPESTSSISEVSSEVGSEYSRRLSNQESSMSLLINPSPSLEFLPGPRPDPKIQRRLMKHITKVICEQTGFILEEKLRSILSPMIDTEKNLIHIDAVLHALGINNAEEMETLGKYILKHCAVNKGIMSKMASLETVGVTEMNVSKEGIERESEATEAEPKTESNPSLKDETTPNQIKIDPRDIADQILDTDQPFKASGMIISESVMKFERPVATSPDGSVDVLFTATSKKDEPVPTQTTNIASEPRPKTVAADGVHETEEKSTPEKTETRPKTAETIKSTEKLDSREEGSDEKTPSADKSKSSGPTHEMLSVEERETITIGHEHHILKSLLSARVDEIPSEGESRSSIVSLKESQEISADPAKLDSFLEEHEGQRVSLLDDDDADLPLLENEDSTTSLKKIIEGLDSDELAQLALEGVNLGTPSGENQQKTDPPPKAVEEEIVPEQAINEVLGHRERDRVEHQSPQDVDGLRENEDAASRSGFKLTPEEEKERESLIGSSILPSMHTTTDNTDEFLFIHPNDVLKALASFCKDYNAKIKVVVRTEEEIINSKLSKLNYPSQGAVAAYWDNVYTVLNPKGKDVWETIENAFELYRGALKERNDCVNEISKLFQQNFELSHLLKNYMNQGATCYGLQSPEPLNPSDLEYCD